MDAKLLKELDENISKMIEIKKGEIGFYYDNIEFLMDLGIPLFRLKQSINVEDCDKEFSQDFDYHTIYQLLSKISPDLLKKYDELYDGGRLKIKREKETEDIGLGEECNFSRKNGLVLVLSKKFDYKSTLVHELMHATNMDTDEKYLTPSILSEFISIYFETYANDIMPSLGIKENEIDYMMRFKMDRDISIKQILIPFIIKSKYGEINEENLLKLHNEKHYFDSIEEYNLEDISKAINGEIELFKIYGKENQERSFLMELLGSCLMSLKYDLATGLAFYARKHLDVNQMLKLNKTLIERPYVDLNYLLETFGIKIDEELKKEAIASVSEYIDEHKKKKTYN